MSVLLGATFFKKPTLPTFTTSDGVRVQPMEQITPNAPTPPSSFNAGSGTNASIYQGGGAVPAIPNPNQTGETLKQDAQPFDSKPQNVDVVSNLKKFAPYIIGGAILLFYVMRKK